MNPSILINPLSRYILLGMSGEIKFYHFKDIAYNDANCKDPNQTPHSAASALYLYCLPLSVLSDDRQI